MDSSGKGETKMTAEEVEINLRYEYWLNHGCECHFLYGDDGEMQCGACIPFVDFKHAPLDELRIYAYNGRLAKARKLTDGKRRK